MIYRVNILGIVSFIKSKIHKESRKKSSFFSCPATKRGEGKGLSTKILKKNWSFPPLELSGQATKKKVFFVAFLNKMVTQTHKKSVKKDFFSFEKKYKFLTTVALNKCLLTNKITDILWSTLLCTPRRWKENIFQMLQKHLL